MIIATYNINGINGRLNELLRWLKETTPDIVCLQELKAETSNFPQEAIAAAGYNAIWLGQKSWNGVAILSKTEIQELHSDLPGEDDEFTHSRYIEGFINGIVIGCIYLPNGNPYPGPKFDYKLRWFRRLAAHAKSLVDHKLPVILMGDYNVMPTELDTYKPEKYIDNALFRIESREAYKDLVNQGWTDAIRTLYPNERIYTFWDYLRNAYERNAGLRLDHFLLNKSVAQQLEAAGVDKHVRGWKGASDHAPVWIELANEDLPMKKQPAVKEKAIENKLEDASDNEAIENAATADIKKLLSAAPKSTKPVNIKPMKATLVDEPFDDPDWLYEVKWDGYRAVAILDKKEKTQLISRNNLPFEKYYPINEALDKWKINAVLDGELLVLNDKGVSDFGAMQNWRSEADGNLVFYIFDILWYEGKDLTNLPLSERVAILSSVLPTDNDHIRQSKSFSANGVDFFAAAEKMGLEGVIAKKASSTYTSDLRSKEWLKIKVQRRQEVVIAGFTKNEGTGKSFSALILGVYKDKELVYVGKVGTGFSDKLQKEMMAQFKPLITNESPFSVEVDVDKPSRFRPKRMGAKPTWLKPELVCEVAYAEVTSDGVFRQASFKGMREDKKAKDVILEVAKHTDTTVSESESKDTEAAKHSKNKADLALAPVKSTERQTLLNPTEDTQVKKVCGHELKFNHVTKFYWPEDKITKGQMLNYYYKVGEYMIPYLKDRPMSLNRFPGGIHGKSFYQKDVSDKAPEWAKTFAHDTDEGVQKKYLVGTDEASLLWMASLGCIEINPWFSRVQSPNNPDYCVIDLDPDKHTYDQVVEAALEVKRVLDAINVPSYPKTSGSTGMHIYIPLAAKYTYKESQLFANIVVKLVHKQIPAFTSIERSIAARGGKMYLDFLQNRPGATIAGPYSLRPKPGATVSMPLSWDEVKPGLTISHFNIHNAIDRLKETGDLFQGVLGKGIDLAETINKSRSIFG